MWLESTICSGAMYAGVPMITPCMVSVPSPPPLRSFATLRSESFGVPSAAKRMLSGLTSRWITPWECAMARASAICVLQRAARHVLHQDVAEVPLGVLARVVHAHQVAVAHRHHQVGLLREAPLVLRGGRGHIRTQRLEGVSFAVGTAHKVDEAQAAPAEQPLHGAVPEPVARLERAAE